jgi:hypothetical protein
MTIHNSVTNNQAADSRPPDDPEHCLSFEEAFGQIHKLFMKCSGTDRLSLLKSIGGLYGHRVIPGTGLQPVVQNVPRVESRPKGPAQPKSSKTAEQLKIDHRIKEKNSEIKEKSKKLGKRLEKDDPLLKERYELFRAKHDAQSSGVSSQSEERH